MHHASSLKVLMGIWEVIRNFLKASQYNEVFLSRNSKYKDLSANIE
jgi:hypothetical protein